MKFGLNDNNKFFVEYTSCSRPIGTVRQEMEIACQKIAHNRNVLISLSGGLDSQVLLHTFHTQNLPYECAFLYHPGYNETEYKQIKILEEKYNFKSIVVTIDVDSYREEVEELSLKSGIPPEHHIMKMFVEQLPDDRDILQGIDSPDFVFKDRQCYCLESWNSMAIARIRALEQLDRKGRIVTIDRRAEFNEFALAYLSDSVVNGYLYSLPYIIKNNLVDKETGKEPPIPFFWEYYVKPIIFGMHWRNELEYFPKFASQTKIAWMAEPKNPILRHNYHSQRVFINRRELINLLTQWGTNKTQHWIEE